MSEAAAARASAAKHEVPVARPSVDREDAGAVDDVHPWVAKARAIDADAGGSDLSTEALARFVHILRAATAGARRAAPGRMRAGRAGRRAPRRGG
jgi:hypothetical protein